MRWSRSDLTPLGIEIDEAEGRLTVFTIATPAGYLRVIADVAEAERSLTLAGAHVEGPGANSVGLANLRLLAQLIMEALDYDTIDIQGAGRTTGAGPSQEHRPRFRFTRRRTSDLP